MTESGDNWSETAWSGVRFLAPQSWQPSEIGQRYLVLEDRQGPVMEIKWGPVKGRFSHKVQLQSMASRQKGALARSLAACDPPPEWKKALQGFDVSGFFWESGGRRVRGVLAHCPECGNVAMIQFFRGGGAPVRVLETFRDHGEGEGAAWALFDIRAVLPNDFILQNHKFMAGRFELGFKSRSHMLRLFRFSPASVLLAKAGMEDFARATLPGLKGAFSGFEHLGSPGLEYEPRPLGGAGRIWDFLPIRPAIIRARFWSLERQNRILAVELSSRIAEPGLFEKICANYEIIA